MTMHKTTEAEHIVDLTEMVTRPDYQSHMGWVSPSYTSSRSVQLDVQAVLDNRCIAIDNNSEEAEIYRILRAQIQRRFEEGEGGRTLMVTSAVAREGKTVTAINLAMILAKEFSQTALLVDCDFRQQQICETLSYQSDKGLADYLLHGTPFPDIIAWPGIEKLTVISGGKPIGASSELLGSPGMRQLIEEMKSRYPERYVIFDSPPVLSCSDSLALATLVDSILVVVRAEQTSRTDIVRALEMLPQNKIIGLVMNRIPAGA